jgi:hypothetical protein
MATPLAAAVAATLNAWLHRSGSSFPTVTLMTSPAPSVAVLSEAALWLTVAL